MTVWEFPFKTRLKRKVSIVFCRRAGSSRGGLDFLVQVVLARPGKRVFGSGPWGIVETDVLGVLMSVRHWKCAEALGMIE
jgi:hypothetical protein